MSRKFSVWLDSGANIHSRYETEVSLDDLGVEDDEWDSMSDEEKDVLMKDIAFNRADWGYKEI